MAVYNTASDAANTMIRAFLTKIGEFYLGQTFNTSTSKGKKLWEEIKLDTFSGKCAFCESATDQLTIEHLVMFNRSQCGLHHPGNVVPCCKSCNKRKRHADSGEYYDWIEQLESVCDNIEQLKRRKKKINLHISRQGYPNLTDDERNALKAVAMSLYNRISAELETSINLFSEIDKTLVKGR